MTDVAGAVASAVRFLAEIFMTREVAQIAAVGRTRKCAGVDLRILLITYRPAEGLR